MFVSPHALSGDVYNTGRNTLIVVTSEGQCLLFDISSGDTKTTRASEFFGVDEFGWYAEPHSAIQDAASIRVPRSLQANFTFHVPMNMSSIVRVSVFMHVSVNDDMRMRLCIHA